MGRDKKKKKSKNLLYGWTEEMTIEKKRKNPP